MRRAPLVATVVVAAAGCAVPAPPVPAPAEDVPPASNHEAARDPALSGVVQRQIAGSGPERYEIVASAPEHRPELAGIVQVERTDAPPFAARLSLKDVLHDADPWTVRVVISRFDADVALPLLTIGETVAIVPIVAIPWLDRDEPRKGVSDVVPRNR